MTDLQQEISASLTRTRDLCTAIRQRAAQVHTDANLDMIARLNAVCALWTEMVIDSRRRWTGVRVER